MLNPSYSSLIRILNEDAGADTRITSRYSVVIAAAKRARQIVGGAEHQAISSSDKAVSIAVNEIQTGNIRIVPGSNGWEFDTIDVTPQNVPSLVDDSYVVAEVEPRMADDEGFEDDEAWDDDEDEENDEDE